MTSVQLRLIEVDDGEDYYEVTYGDSSVFEFHLDPTTGVYVSTEGDGAYETMWVLDPNNNESPAYVITRSDQTRLFFNKQQQLVRIEDTNGVWMEYQWMSDRLVRVIDDIGHELQYVYQGGQGKLKKIVDEHFGTISFADRPEGGTIVTLCFDAGALSQLAGSDTDRADLGADSGEERAPVLTRIRK